MDQKNNKEPCPVCGEIEVFGYREGKKGLVPHFASCNSAGYCCELKGKPIKLLNNRIVKEKMNDNGFKRIEDMPDSIKTDRVKVALYHKDWYDILGAVWGRIERYHENGSGKDLWILNNETAGYIGEGYLDPEEECDQPSHWIELP